MVNEGAVCLNWACTESARGEVSDGLLYLNQRLGQNVSGSLY